MPAPMMAPTPSAVSWNGPSVRLRLWPPASCASARSMLIGFLANKGLPMQLLLWGIYPAANTAKLDDSILGARRAAPLGENSITARGREQCSAGTIANRPALLRARSPGPAKRFASYRAGEQT